MKQIFVKLRKKKKCKKTMKQSGKKQSGKKQSGKRLGFQFLISVCSSSSVKFFVYRKVD